MDTGMCPVDTQENVSKFIHCCVIGGVGVWEVLGDHCWERERQNGGCTLWSCLQLEAADYIKATQMDLKNIVLCEKRECGMYLLFMLIKNSQYTSCKNTYIKYSLSTLEWLPVGLSAQEQVMEQMNKEHPDSVPVSVANSTL